VSAGLDSSVDGRPPTAGAADTGAGPSVDLDAVRDAAGGVPDPEIRKTIAELDLLDEVEVDAAGVAVVRYHLTSPLCPSPFAVQIGREMRRRVEAVPGVTRCVVDIADHFIAADIARLVNEDEGR
jgi:metal-sulfur cluster biosynthetic enzyme